MAVFLSRSKCWNLGMKQYVRLDSKLLIGPIMYQLEDKNENTKMSIFLVLERKQY